MKRPDIIIRRITLFAICLFLGAAQLAAQDSTGQAERAALDFRTNLQRIQGELQLPTITDQQLTEDRRSIEDIRTKVVAESAKLDNPIKEIAQQIARLGKPPDPPQEEPPAIVTQRSTLQSSLDKLQAAKKQLDVIAVEAEQLSGRASTLQRDQFFKRIFEGSKSILNPSLWYDTVIGLGQLYQRLGALFSTWWADTRAGANFAGLLIIPLAMAGLAGLYFVFRRRVRQWFDTGILASRSPDEIDRLWRVVRAMLGTWVLLIAAQIVLVTALVVSGLMTPRLEVIVGAVTNVIFNTVSHYVLGRRIAAPGLPSWRIINIGDTSASRLPVLFGLAAFVSSFTSAVETLTDRLYLPVSNTIGQTAISTAMMVVLLVLIMVNLGRTQSDYGRTREGTFYFGWAKPLAPIAWLLIVISAVGLLLGYIALGSFVVRQVFETAVLIVVLFLLHHLSDEAVLAGLDPSTGFGRFLRRVGGLSDRGIARIGLISRTLVDIVLVVVGLPLLFLQWTVTWIDFRAILNTAFFGFKVGDVTVSPWSAFLVLASVVAGVVLTNFIVRWLDFRILTSSRINQGVQDSIKKGASYAGYILAALFGLTAAGLDFSNLAIIAGALGVGIGFGLQSIVNNFVSGLILLAERPIRQGDWIALPAGEGIVKRINVRATLIETFDNCTIVVPNSQLITEPVRNWTYGDSLGRFTISLNVEYGNDPLAVCKLLTEIANTHRAVMSDPPANALFTGFGDIGMKFELKAHVADVFEAVFVASDIRMAIDKAFKESSIRIPTVLPPRPVT